VAAYQLLFFAGVGRAGVAIGTVVAIGSAPAFAGALGWAAARERPGRRWAAATAVAVLGAALLIAASAGGGGGALGIAYCLGAGASYAAYAVASKRLMVAGHPSAAVMAVAFAGGAVLLLPVLVGRDVGWLADGRGVVIALHLGVATTVVAYLLFGIGLGRLPVAVAATLSLAEPLTASLLGVLLLGERLRAPQWAGALLLLAGLALLTAPVGRRPRKVDVLRQRVVR
jgi:DME family drug/metabolite transporter